MTSRDLLRSVSLWLVIDCAVVDSTIRRGFLHWLASTQRELCLIEASVSREFSH